MTFRVLQVEYPSAGKCLLMGGWDRAVPAAPRPFWEVFPGAGSTSENGVCIPERAATHEVPA